MPKPLKIILITVGCLILLLAIGFIILIKSLEPKIPKPVSDVPVEYKIGWWGHQNALEVEKLNTKVVSGNLHLFNNKSVVEYSITGTLNYSKGWRPYIRAVYISERWVDNNEGLAGKSAEIIVIPIAATKKDNSYNGQPINFNVTVQDYLQTGSWGTNIYNVSCMDYKSAIVLHQRK